MSAGTQTRFPTMKLPKPLTVIHTALDEIELAKKRRARDAEKITTLKLKVAKTMKANKSKLGRLPHGGILYYMNGYRVELSAEEKVTTKIEQES